DGLNRDTVRLDAAIAATLADKLVDEHAPIRIRKRAALATTSLLGGAGLVVNKDGNALHLAQFALHPIEIVAVMDRGSGRERGRSPIFLRLVGDHGDALDTLGAHLMGDHVDAETALMGLA